MLAAYTFLQNRYRIVRQLGHSGMGTVYQAIDERLNTIVAVKETTAESERLRRAFKREASLLANLHHPVLPAVKDHFNEGNRRYIVMQFIPGNCRFLLTRSKPTEIIEVTFYCRLVLVRLSAEFHLMMDRFHFMTDNPRVNGINNLRGRFRHQMKFLSSIT